MVVFVGPVLFYLLKTSLEFGKTNGMLVVLGIIISDIVVAFLCYFGLGRFLSSPEAQIWLSFAGGIILLTIGIKYLVAKNRDWQVDKKITVKNRLIFFSNGFLVNFVNPFVFGVWIGVVAYGNKTFGNQENQILFLVGSLLGILTTDSVKVLLADYLKRFLQPSRMSKIYKVAGTGLILFSFRLLYHGLSRIIVF